MKFSDYSMLSTQMRNEDIATAIKHGDPQKAQWIKKATDTELFNPRELLQLMDGMLNSTGTDLGIAGLTAEQRRLFASAVYKNEKDLNGTDVWTVGTESARLLAELEWKRLGRPYYNIWPSMVKPLTTCSLKGVLGKHIELPLTALVIRLPDPQGTMLYMKDANITFVWLLETGLPLLTMFSDDSPMDGDSKSTLIVDDTTAQVRREKMRRVLAIVAGVALLSHNKDIIEPIVLNADTHRYKQTHDVSLIEKAKRKGTFGFDVGRHVETAPGFRQAHFAIRWKGKGRTRRELVPVKGCMVHRKLVTEVPTGYLDKDEAVAAVSEGQVTNDQSAK